MSNQTCENCRFFKASNSYGGKCRAHPPLMHQQIDRIPLRWLYPEMSKDAWCGEWQEVLTEKEEPDADMAGLRRRWKRRVTEERRPCDYCGWSEEAGVAHDCVKALRQKIETLEAQLGSLMACRRGEQNCHECPDIECSDNMRKER